MSVLQLQDVWMVILLPNTKQLLKNMQCNMSIINYIKYSIFCYKVLSTCLILLGYYHTYIYVVKFIAYKKKEYDVDHCD